MRSWCPRPVIGLQRRSVVPPSGSYSTTSKVVTAGRGEMEPFNAQRLKYLPELGGDSTGTLPMEAEMTVGASGSTCPSTLAKYDFVTGEEGKGSGGRCWAKPLSLAKYSFTSSDFRMKAREQSESMGFPLAKRTRPEVSRSNLWTCRNSDPKAC